MRAYARVRRSCVCVSLSLCNIGSSVIVFFQTIMSY